VGRGVGRSHAPSEENGTSPESLTDLAYIKLEELIVRLDLARNCRFGANALPSALASATPIREALAALARERLVRILPQRGVIVSDIDVRKSIC